MSVRRAHRDARAPRRRRRHERGSSEFERVINLSDGVFAIAMTLLVFTLDASAVSLEGFTGAWRDQQGELIAFGLSFAVIANFWLTHHRFLSLLGALEPGLMLLNLTLLGAVALVPFPTSLLGRDPTAAAAVVPYLALLTFVASTHLLLLVRAHRVKAWHSPMPDRLFRWLLAAWGASTGVTVLALAVVFLVPVAGLAMLLLTWPAEALVARFAPAGFADWG